MQNVDSRVDQRFEPGFQCARRVGQLHFIVLLLPLADPQQDRKIRSDRRAHRVDDISGKPGPPGQVLASVGILAAIGTLPEELIDQIAVAPCNSTASNPKRFAASAASAKARMASAMSSSLIGSPNFFSGRDRPDGLS